MNGSRGTGRTAQKTVLQKDPAVKKGTDLRMWESLNSARQRIGNTHPLLLFAGRNKSLRVQLCSEMKAQIACHHLAKKELCCQEASPPLWLLNEYSRFFGPINAGMKWSSPIS